MQLTGMNMDAVIGKLHFFWYWCQKYAEDGDLRTHGLDAACKHVGMRKEDLIASRWVDERPYLRVHDWWDHAGAFLMSKYKKSPDKWQRIKKLYGNSSRNSYRTGYVTVQGTDEIRQDKIRKEKITPSLAEPAVRELVDEFFSLQQLKLGERPAHFPGGQAAKFFKAQLKQFPKDEIRRRLDLFFQSTDKFVAARGYAFSQFQLNFNMLKQGALYADTRQQNGRPANAFVASGPDESSKYD